MLTLQNHTVLLHCPWMEKIMFSALFSGVVDNLMQQLQFNTTNRQPLNGVSSKKATHFVDGDDKFASSDAALKSRCCLTE